MSENELVEGDLLPPDPDAEGLIPVVPAERYPDGE